MICRTVPVVTHDMGHTNFDTTDGYIDVEQPRINDIRNSGTSYILTHKKPLIPRNFVQCKPLEESHSSDNNK